MRRDSKNKKTCSVPRLTCALAVVGCLMVQFLLIVWDTPAHSASLASACMVPTY